jgi:virginiamycin B lyase
MRPASLVKGGNRTQYRRRAVPAAALLAIAVVRIRSHMTDASRATSLALFLVGLLGLGSAIAPAAGADIYWANQNSNSIGRASVDGTSVDQSFITGASQPGGVAIDGSHVYWTNFNSSEIGRANLNGTGANQNFVTSAGGPNGVAVDGSHIYWANGATNAIGRANLNGTGANQSFIGANGPIGVAVDGSHIYWVNSGTDTIARANLNGSSPNQSFITGTNGATGVAVDGAHVYWTNAIGNTIGRANLNGSSPNQSFITGGNDPVAVAADGYHVYWTNHGSNTIGRANVDSTGVDQSFITGAHRPSGIAAAPGAIGPRLYVTDNQSPGAVVPVPLSTLIAGSAITPAIGAFPPAVAISPDARRAFTANGGSATISAINTNSNRASELNLTAFGGPLGIAVSPNGSQVFAATPAGIAIVNAHTLAVNSSTIPVGNDPQGIAFSPDGKFAYVANNGDGTVSVIATSSDTVTATISLGLPANPCALAVTPNGAKVVVIGGCYDPTGGVSIISTATNNATSINSLGTHPFEAVAMSPNAKAAYVYDNTTGDIWQVDPRTGATPANPLVNGAGGIRGLALSPSGSRLFATRSGSGTVSMINPLSAAITPISTGVTVPWADAVTPEQAPHAALSATAAPAGSATKLRAVGTTTYDGGAAKYAWSFGDGHATTTTTPTVSHVYKQLGKYTASVTVTDDQGCATKLIYTGQTASCNGGLSARKSVSFAVPAK